MTDQQGSTSKLPDPVELSQAITVDRRVTQVASSTADLVAQAPKQISQAEITDISSVLGYAALPPGT